MTKNIALPNVTLVTGAARSGKSEWAETLAVKTNKPVIYVATAQCDPHDPQWQQRIERHKQRRPTTWKTLETPILLAQAIETAASSTCLLVDSLGTWVANSLEQEEDIWQQTTQSLISALAQTQSEIILVAEETGWGVVPAYPAGRLFRDRLGSLTRQIGSCAGSVYLITAGHALDLKTLGQPLD